ncbi:argininosuccinate synthase-like [Penaeus chinensis]|uniref:argininosuccinate synthase-like n=1 Tax=Penaeus chinensis TaxID=139456 RepID=UPI001FB5C12D|nr:argininosuccinate synthase-like [Penaeus chinensis]
MANALHCEDDAESLTVDIHLAEGPFKLYNVYSKPGCRILDVSQNALAYCLRCNENVEVLEARLINVLNKTVAQIIPKTRPWSRRQRTPDNLALLKGVVRGDKENAKIVRQKSSWNGVSPLTTEPPLQNCGNSSDKLTTAQPRGAHTTTLNQGQIDWSMSSLQEQATDWQSGVLENPSAHPPEGIFQMTTDPEKAPETPQVLTIAFNKGIPCSVIVAGDATLVKDPLEIFCVCNSVGAKHGVGRIDIVENRFVGLKSRGIYETPGLTILRAAHLDLEALCIDREVRKIKAYLSTRMSEMVYNGLWYSPEFEYTKDCISQSQKQVTGSVTVKVYKGNVYVLGRSAPVSLYNQELVSMDVQGDYEPGDAHGFIKINAVRLREYERVKQIAKSN